MTLASDMRTRSPPKPRKGDPDAAQARREGKNDVKAAMKRIAANGPAALNYALTLLDNPQLTHGTNRKNQPATISRKARWCIGRETFRQPRLETREAEADWLKQAPVSG